MSKKEDLDELISEVKAQRAELSNLDAVRKIVDNLKDYAQYSSGIVGLSMEPTWEEIALMFAQFPHDGMRGVVLLLAITKHQLEQAQANTTKWQGHYLDLARGWMRYERKN